MRRGGARFPRRVRRRPRRWRVKPPRALLCSGTRWRAAPPSSPERHSPLTEGGPSPLPGAAPQSALQSQLEGVRLGLSQLHGALARARETGRALRGVRAEREAGLAALEPLGDLRGLADEHGQLAAAVEHTRIIMSVRELEQETRDWIEQGELLAAHKNLMELEHSRDSLLLRQHLKDAGNAANLHLIREYFSCAESLDGELAKQLWLVVQRGLGTARRDPAMLVSALRVIEREEGLDALADERRQSSGFVAPGRPKELRRRCMEVLQQTVSTRVESGQTDTRDDDSLWLARHLDTLQRRILEDLVVVKTLMAHCFPPKYNIFSATLRFYHRALGAHLRDIVSEQLEANEIVSLLTWVLHTYPSEEMMRHPDLAPEVSVEELPPLLSPGEVEALLHKYLHTLQSNVCTWLGKALEAERRDWMRNQEPDTDQHGYFHTALPAIVCQMLEQNVQVASQVSPRLVGRATTIGLLEVQTFLCRYRAVLGGYRQEHAQNRQLPPFYVQYMTAATNNCLAFKESMRQLLEKRPTFGAPGVEGPSQEAAPVPARLPDLTTQLDGIAADACEYLLDEVLLDIEPLLQELLTRAWVSSSRAMDTICATVEDYFSDFSKLKKPYLQELTERAHRRLVSEFVRAAVQRRVSFKGCEERREAAEKMEWEARQLKQLFQKLSHGPLSEDSLSDVIPALAELVRLKDTSMLCLEISGLLHKYPDVREEHIWAVLALRGDATRDMRLVLTECMMQRRAHVSAPAAPPNVAALNFFADIPVTNHLLPQLGK
ncbi:exocyst complex component 3-like isoform X1 [Lampetra planeri]